LAGMEKVVFTKSVVLGGVGKVATVVGVAKLPVASDISIINWLSAPKRAA